MRLGILAHGFMNWSGGVDFLRMVCNSLLATEQVELHILTPTHGIGPRLSRLLQSGRALCRKTIWRETNPQRFPSIQMINALSAEVRPTIPVHQIATGTQAIDGASKVLRLDAVLPAFTSLGAARTPWVGYLYDFQHRHLPNLFSTKEREHRDIEFTKMLMQARTVIVNSRAVADDIRRFYPDHSAMIFSLPFSAAPNLGWLTLMPPLKKYAIEKPYFIICNQFWQHKNHETAFRAFSVLLEKFPELLLVCTGETNDYRNPGYFSYLKNLAKQIKIENNLLILGLIPKSDQIGLMRGSLAVIQPTLFEGGPGGGSVHDALSLGIPTIVSDIVVNSELEHNLVTFFSNRNYESLAAAMSSFINKAQVRSIDRDILISQAKIRQTNCGNVLLRAVNESISITN